MTVLSNLKRSNLSELLDRISGLAVTDRDRKVLEQIQDFYKLSRYSAFQDYNYDVLSLINRTYNRDTDYTTCKFYKTILDSIVENVPYDASRE